MLTQKHMTNSPATRASILMKTGACVGGTIIGYISQWFGRRRTIIVAALMSGFLIPAWILPEGERSLSASGFFMQFFVQGAWGKLHHPSTATNTDVL
jgi:MFS-type transporter involved in bile tolerance (Atg22 family)